MEAAPTDAPFPDAQLRADADFLGALAHPMRLRILRQLLVEPCCVSDLVDHADALQPKVSRHLAVLREAGLVACEARGRRRCYHLRRPDLVAELLALLAAHRDAEIPGASP